MIGAIIGDIVGSTRESVNIKTENFELLPPSSQFTDDSVMTIAVAEWLMRDPEHRHDTLVDIMHELGNAHFWVGYGGRFRRWLKEKNPRPYNSWGNGSGMRVSPVGLYARNIEECLNLAKISAEVTHNHPEGIKGAQAIAACVYLNRTGVAKAEIKEYVESTFGYNLDIDLEELRPSYTFEISCQGSVPVAIMAFLQRDTAEGALRLAISMGGDSDTIGAMTYSIVAAKGCPDKELADKCYDLLTPDLQEIVDRFDIFLKTQNEGKRMGLQGAI